MSRFSNVRACAKKHPRITPRPRAAFCNERSLLIGNMSGVKKRRTGKVAQEIFEPLIVPAVCG